MIKMNAFVTFIAGESYGFTQFCLPLAINNGLAMDLYPIGYLADWASLFIFGIVWAVSLVSLYNPPKPKRQPWKGFFILGLSVILAFLTWFILGFKLGWKGYDMILLGTCGFLIFPIWATLFGYWPFTEKRAEARPFLRGAVFITISWILAFVLRGIAVKMIWSNPIGNLFTMYLNGNVATPLFSTEPYDVWISSLLSIIVAFAIISQLNLFQNMTQPMRGTLLLIIGVILGLIMWFILTLIVGKGSQSVLLMTTVELVSPITIQVPVMWTFPYVSHANISAYLAFPLITLLAGQFTFQMWPWSRWGKWAGLFSVIVAFIVGSILYYIIMITPGYAAAITGANLISPMSGAQVIYLFALELYFTMAGLGLSLPVLAMAYWVFAVYFEGLAIFMGRAIMFAWVLTVMIYYLLVYEGLEHWPWK
jgi:hypothetical protein